MQIVKESLKRGTRLCVWIAVLAAIGAACRLQAQDTIVGMDLGAPVSHAPLSSFDWKQALTIDRFAPANGEGAATAKTSASLEWDTAALYIFFRCEDPDPIYRQGIRLQRSDRVAVGIVPPGGKQEDLWEFAVDQNGKASLTHAGTTSPLAGTIVRLDGQDWTQVNASGEWTAQLTVPWPLLGGVPRAPFSVQLARVRYLTGELLSPSAVDYHDGPVATDKAPNATDEFIETTLGGKKGTHTAGFGLITLPSGAKRWERRGSRLVITEDQLREITQLQGELDKIATSESNLSARVRIAEMWYSLLEQEGVSFHNEGGTWILQQGELDPWTARHRFNDAMAANDTPTAGAILDSLLKHFSRVSAAWFADGTPGDVGDAQWSTVSSIESASVQSNEIVLRGKAGGKPVDLFVSFLRDGGVRIHGKAVGFFSPDGILPLRLENINNGVRANTDHLAVAIALKDDWHIQILRRNSPDPFWSIQKGDLRVRWLENGTLAGIEIKGTLKPAEAIVGFGERFDSLNQRGKTVNLWQQDAWDALAGGGLQNQAYKNIPLWHSTSGYSVFWDSSYQLRADVGNTDRNRYRITSHGMILDLYIWPGDYQENLRRYTALTGRPWMPPVWAFEPWMGGGGGRWARTPGVLPARAILDEVNKFDRLDIPHSAVYAEGSASEDPELYRELYPANMRILTWARCQALGWKLDEIKKALPDLSESQLPLMHDMNGSIYMLPEESGISDEFPYIDFTAPRSADLLRAYWKPRLDLGVMGSMIDFGDVVPRDARFFDGSTGEQMHNWYAHFYQHAVHQMFSERRGEDHVLFARGGAPGTQAELANFAGDHASNFRGFDESITGGLSAATAGFSNWGDDLGGYSGKADEEVYIRWVEWGAFTPIMRFHGDEPREPWYYSDIATDVYKKFTWVRENIVPYLYGSSQDAHNLGIPLIRLVSTASMDEYMLGDDLLVAPVHAPGEHRPVTLPTGKWTDLWTGLPVQSSTDMKVPLETIPVFLRAGALVPMNVAPDFALGESMSSAKVPALFITPPDQGNNSHEWTLPGKDAATKLESIPRNSGFRLVINNWPDLRFIIVAGDISDIGSIEVDNQTIPKLTPGQSASLPIGWMQLDRGRLLVRLPVSSKHVVEFNTAVQPGIASGRK